MLRKSIAVLLALLVACVALALPVAADVTYQSWCPNCGKFQAQGSVTQHSYCATCGAYLVSPELSGGDSQGAGAGRRLGTAKRYYTSPSDGNLYNSGATEYYQILDTTNNTLNYNNQTVNYNNYEWNAEYNYYTYYVDNSANYYVTENVTYVTISYPIVSNEVVTYETAILYYQLPDGRNSYNLTASDVWGTYFNYDAVNYLEVPEDDGVTLGLWHLDENFFDSSANQFGSFSSSSYNFVETPFGSGICLDGTGTVYKSINSPTFSPIGDWTFEFRVKVPRQLYNKVGTSFTPSSVYVRPFNCAIAVPIGEWVSVAVVCSGGFLHCFVNGVEVRYGVSSVLYDVGSPCAFSTSSFAFSFYSYCYIQHTSTSDYLYGELVYDEIRLSNKALYTGNYTPSAQPFDTNSVLVLPESGQQGDIAVKSNIAVNGFRVGGVRPTYPLNGYVYVYLEDNVVKDVQQYQGNGWYQVDGAVYDAGTWQPLKDFDLSGYAADDPSAEPDNPGPSPTPDPDNPGGDDDGKSIWDKLVDAILGFFSIVGKVIGGLLTGLVTLVTGAVSQIGNLVNVFGDFGTAMASMYTWLPEDWRIVLSAGFSIVIIIAIVALIRGK